MGKGKAYSEIRSRALRERFLELVPSARHCGFRQERKSREQNENISSLPLGAGFFQSH